MQLNMEAFKYSGIIEKCIYPPSTQNKHHYPQLRGQEYQIRVLVASIEKRPDNSRR